MKTDLKGYAVTCFEKRISKLAILILSVHYKPLNIN